MSHTQNSTPNYCSLEMQADYPAGSPELNLNFFQASTLQFKAEFAQTNFEESKDKSLKLFSIQQQVQQTECLLMLKAHTNHQETTQDNIYNVLCFRRGFSEHYDLDLQLHTKYERQCQSNLSRRKPNSPAISEQGVDVNLTSDDELAKSMQCSVQKVIIKEQQGGSQKKVTTKNITKNMGKLLFKWIWTNKTKLQARLKSTHEIWEHFVQQLKIWKKENNVTRKFLCQKWQGQDATCKLFRIISAHFFRKYCLASICQSNIADKLIHVKRVHKFLEAVSDSTALDTLN